LTRSKHQRHVLSPELAKLENGVADADTMPVDLGKVEAVLRGGEGGVELVVGSVLRKEIEERKREFASR